MEFIIVRFRVSRDVFVDGMEMGKTGEKLRVERGRQVFKGNPFGS